jgi:malate synthase
MNQYVQRANIQVALGMVNFIEQEVLVKLAIEQNAFWQGFSDIIHRHSDENRRLLTARVEFQQQIDDWYQSHSADDINGYRAFLQQIGYLVPEPADFTITADRVDAEIATMAGPQLVVPIMNARFALNAVNARWGSLYDALYGSDVLPWPNGKIASAGYDASRGQQVIDYVKTVLDQYLPLRHASHQQVTGYFLTQQTTGLVLNARLSDGAITELSNHQAFKGYLGQLDKPDKLLLQHHGLYIELQFDPHHLVGKQDPAGLSDVQLEAALSTIMDCEDSVAAVDAEDKVLAYRNWLQLNQGTLTEQITKQGNQFIRKMQLDREYLDVKQRVFSVKSRSLMFIRNVGHLMTNNAILDQHQNPVFEGIMDAVISSLIALHDITKSNGLANSSQGSIYIVKPKMHGPAEVKFANQLFGDVEQLLQLPANTIKMGIMDEERRTSVNLKACIFQAKDRVVFINTGFLDRTGDEIHTCMAAGAVVAKSELKQTAWLNAYELANVAVGLNCGFAGRAQIGKGMWPIPEQMAAMMSSKISHPLAGASTAWVPSPTAATLHALHYHQVNVFEQQATLTSNPLINAHWLTDMLTPPLAKQSTWSTSTIEQEIDNNVQGILGYVVRWIDQGIGCSKVPDIHNVGLMEDRATLRISSQHLANWLKHGICTDTQVVASLAKMAKVVDQQNATDTHYQKLMINNEQSIAMQAAKALIFEAEQQANGYTEPLLHQFRQLKKQTMSH